MCDEARTAGIKDLKEIHVYGEQKPMGSKKAFYNPKTKRVILTDQSGGKLKSWQHDIRTAMQEDMGFIEGPVKVEITFWIPRPKAHFGTGKNANVLKPNAPTRVTTKPDLDKLARAVLDCGSGIWYRDDSQVAILELKKLYGDSALTVVRAEAA